MISLITLNAREDAMLRSGLQGKTNQNGGQIS